MYAGEEAYEECVCENETGELGFYLQAKEVPEAEEEGEELEVNSYADAKAVEVSCVGSVGWSLRWEGSWVCCEDEGWKEEGKEEGIDGRGENIHSGGSLAQPCC